MFISGFTIVRNAIRYDYPVVEAITSILPVCNEVVVAVGQSDDQTLELIKEIGSPKIRIIETEWSMQLREGGRVLAVETDKALQAISPQADWAFYIQADEILHEEYAQVVVNAMRKYQNDPDVEGLLFKYLHFYGSYDFVGDSRRWYRNEVRIIRPGKGITSYRDAQGFRINGKRLKVKPSGATIYHYGWVKPPEKQQAKQQNFHKLWHSDDWVAQNIKQAEGFEYSSIDSLALFKGTHPQVMRPRVETQNWKFDFDPTHKNFGLKSWLLWRFEKLTGIRIGEYRNYRLI
ncbi:MAG TPA: glycosyl transferase [Bacteroidales bacterium]|nr:MAG: glycosyl transferase [Bacteroidetes bacterium GWE2_42_24]OFY29948.1 MAG: glycosyl transferase [Bacteroidetes bacterium GWF2_43_11]HBZ67865.1 glycosyl transferase [Bacteroidales bacterium]